MTRSAVSLLLIILGLLFPKTSAGAGPIYCSWGEAEGFRPWGRDEAKMQLHNNDSRPVTISIPTAEPTSDFTLVTRFLNHQSYPVKRYSQTCSPAYGIILTSSAGDSLKVLTNVECEENPIDFTETPVIRIERIHPSGQIQNQKVKLSEILYRKGFKQMILRISATNGMFSVEAGTSVLNHVWHDKSISFSVDSIGYYLEPGGDIEICAGAMMIYPQRIITGEISNIEELRKRIEYSTDPIEGEWEYHDRTFEETLLRPGGHYRLIAVRHTNGDYEIYYISGAKINPSLWQPGMLKARLHPSTGGHYQLQWRDASGVWMTHDLSAALESPEILTLLFPYQQSSLRLQRVR